MRERLTSLKENYKENVGATQLAVDDAFQRISGSVASELSRVWYGERVKNKRPALFRGRHFQDEIIVLCLRWYLRYSLSYRDLEQMMAERGHQPGSFHDRSLSSPLCAHSESANSR
jgi:hypothetical protein